VRGPRRPEVVPPRRGCAGPGAWRAPRPFGHPGAPAGASARRRADRGAGRALDPARRGPPATRIHALRFAPSELCRNLGELA